MSDVNDMSAHVFRALICQVVSHLPEVFTSSGVPKHLELHEFVWLKIRATTTVPSTGEKLVNLETGPKTSRMGIFYGFLLGWGELGNLKNEKIQAVRKKRIVFYFSGVDGIFTKQLHISCFFFLGWSCCRLFLRLDRFGRSVLKAQNGEIPNAVSW